MKISFLWLKEFVDFSESPAEIAALLRNQGFDVASLAPVGGPVSGVVVACVESVQKHPNADKLKLCEVNDGLARHLVVCGAPNVEAGKKYPFARLGAKLPDGLLIEKRSLRGVPSHGMLCSARELGLGEDHSGLYLLAEEAPLGQDVSETLALGDAILDVEVTPNRPDVLSHWGVAREIAAGLGKPLREPSLEVPSGKQAVGLVRLEEPRLCDRYVARVFENVRVGVAPLGVRLRLERCGIRSINNVVDVTNYVLLELGHPLHVFDLSRLSGGRVCVRMGRPGETLACLDNVQRSVEGVLVVADGSGPVAVAGVMGGAPTGVGGETTQVFLESARFLPAQVRRARGRLGISTESSYRFERGTDLEMVERASRRAANLLLRWAGGVLEAQQDVRESLVSPNPLRVSFERLQQLLGMSVSVEEARSALESFGFRVESTGELWKVVAPLHRADVRETPDVVEEVARRMGYDRVEGRVRSAPSGGGPPSRVRSLARAARECLIGLGFWEAAQSGLVPRTLWERWAGEKAENPPELLNPLSVTGECLNPSLLVNLLVCLEGNVRRGCADARLFESARVFHRGKDGVEEADHFAWVATGRNHAEHWRFRARPLEIWDARAWTKAIFKDWRLAGARFVSESRPFLHPTESQSIRLGGELLGFYGRIHPRQAERWGLPPHTFVGEINLSLVCQGTFLDLRYQDFSRQPALVRDFSLLFPEKVSWSSIVFWIHGECEWVEGVELFDVFHGADLPEGTRSLAFRVRFRHPDRTLTDVEAQRLQQRLITGLSKSHGAQSRGTIPS